MSQTFGIQHTIAQDVTISIFQIHDGSLVFAIDIESPDGRELDKHRLPLVMLESKVVKDFGDSKEYQRLIDELDAKDGGSSTPSFTYKPTSISAVVWHGQVKEGLGFVGDLLLSKGMKIRVYLKDYSTHEYTVPPDIFDDLRAKLRSAFNI